MNLSERIIIYQGIFAILATFALIFNAIGIGIACMILFACMIIWQKRVDYINIRDNARNVLAPYMNLLRCRIGKNWNGDDKTNWRVVSAASKNRDNGLIAVGARHFDKVMRSQMFALSGCKYADAANWQNVEESELSVTDGWKLSTQGFIDNYGDFLSRKEAYIVAKFAGQIQDPKDGVICPDNGETLFSENLY